MTPRYLILLGMVLLTMTTVSLAAVPNTPIRMDEYKDVIRVACVGDSITYGLNIVDRAKNSYPAVLGRLLGPQCDVRNYGVSGATLLKKGWLPYWDLPEFAAAKAFNPDVVILKLGTNDANPNNLQFKDDFMPNLREMLDQFANLPSKPKIWLCLPVPIYGVGEYKIAEDNLKDEVIPMLQQVADEKGIPMIDLFTLMSNHVEFFPDNLHPTPPGAALMAHTIFQTITGLPAPPEITPCNSLFLDTTTVSISAQEPGVEIRYTLNGTTPTRRSSRYTAPFTIKKTTTVTAAMFRDGKMVSLPATSMLTKATLRPALQVIDVTPGLHYQYYEADAELLEAPEKLQPVKEDAIGTFALPAGTRKEHFAVVYQGYLKVPADGLYTFYLMSDDGCRLQVDGSDVVTNRVTRNLDETSGTIALTAGQHAIKLVYFQQQGNASLNVKYAGPGVPKQDIPATQLSY